MSRLITINAPGTRHRLLCLIWLFCSFSSAAFAQDEKRIPFSQAAQNAVQRSQLTLPGSAPFHLKAHIADAANADPAYTAEIEEQWVSPIKWRRTIKAAGFSQTLIVDGGKVSERDKGDYYPFWLRDLVTAIFDPLPMLAQLKRINSPLEIPTDSPDSNACMQIGIPSGTATLKNTLNYAFCFQGGPGLLQDVVTPGFRAHFQDYKPFKGKSVAHNIVFSPEPATRIEAHITELLPLAKVGDRLFAIDDAAPTPEQLKSTQVGEPTARTILLNSPAIQWPSVREGKTSGIMSLYVSVDKAGHIREVWPFQSDNPELTRAACKQLRQWQFKPYVNGVPMQMESVLTFAFEAKQGPPIPVLTNAEARKLAMHVVEPHVEPHVEPRAAARGTRFTLRVAVDEKGRLMGVRNPKKVKPALFQAGNRALRQWRFRPYVKNGSPDRFYADISFVVK
jgi:hypothetical protein